MKRILCVLSAAFLVLTSCSKDDNSSKGDDSSKPAAVLVKKVVYEDKGGLIIREFLYDGSKLTAITGSDGVVYKYTCTRDLITKIEILDKDGKLESTTEFIYDNGKLSTSIEKEIHEEYYKKTKYVHNTDGTISYYGFRVNVATGIEQKDGNIGKYTYSNGNLVKDENSENGSDSLTILEYDVHNSPYKNITGVNLILEDGLSSINNVTKKTYTSKESDTPDINIYAYKYNADNYPTARVLTFSGTSETTQFEY